MKKFVQMHNKLSINCSINKLNVFNLSKSVKLKGYISTTQISIKHILAYIFYHGDFNFEKFKSLGEEVFISSYVDHVHKGKGK